MKICHVCSAECEDTAELCKICGAELKGVEENNELQSHEIEITNPVLVAEIEDVVSAEIFKDILTENGIVFTGGEEDTGYLKMGFGGCSFVAEEIYVDEKDYEKALGLYDNLNSSEFEFTEDFEESLDEDSSEELSEE